eukprot:12424599-Karenia_brevis.AAC.1
MCSYIYIDTCKHKTKNKGRLNIPGRERSKGTRMRKKQRAKRDTLSQEGQEETVHRDSWALRDP